jgi:hypothetical protein
MVTETPGQRPEEMPEGDRPQEMPGSGPQPMPEGDRRKCPRTRTTRSSASANR